WGRWLHRLVRSADEMSCREERLPRVDRFLDDNPSPIFFADVETGVESTADFRPAVHFCLIRFIHHNLIHWLYDACVMTGKLYDLSHVRHGELRCVSARESQARKREANRIGYCVRF